MTGMLERAARAACAADITDESDISHYFEATEHHGDCTKQNYTCLVCLADHYRDQARAMLEAIREPTEEMADYAWDNMTKGYEDSTEEWREAWRFMIDAILGTAGRASDG